MKSLILYFLKGRHERMMNKFHQFNYKENYFTVYVYEKKLLWDKIISCRNKIRRLEPTFLVGFDD